MIYLTTYGSAKMVYDKHLGSVMNYVSWRDAVSFIADPIGHIRGIFSKKVPITYLESYSFPFIDHSFRSDTYRQAMISNAKSKIY
jgi:hypothetical protein